MARTKTKKTVRSAYEVAVELQAVRHNKSDLLALDKKLSTELKALMASGEQQDIFGYETSRSIEITDQEKAVAWAQAEYPHIITVDTKAAKSILQRSLLALPEGFEMKETQRLVELGGKNEE